MVIAVLGAASLVLNFIMYCVVFRVVKKHQAKIRVDIQLAGHFHGRRAVDMRKIKHSSWTSSVCLFLVFHMLCSFCSDKNSGELQWEFNSGWLDPGTGDERNCNTSRGLCESSGLLLPFE